MNASADSPYELYQWAMESYSAGDFAAAEPLFLQAIRQSNETRNNSVLVNSLVWYGFMLVKMDRPRDAIAQWERRLALKRFDNEDRHERRATKWHLEELKAEIAAAGDAE